MHAIVGANRRSPLLTGFVGLCLIVLAGLPVAANRHLVAGAGDAVAAAVSDLAVAVRTVPDRLSPAHRAGFDRHVPSSAALPAAVLLAFLLAARKRDSDFGTTPRPQLLRAAGRSPPVTS